MDDGKDLEKLLDDALNDFKPTPKTSDDDLDEYMQKVDIQATKKAAENFQSMLERLVTTMESEQEQRDPNMAGTSNSNNNNEDHRKITKSLSDLLFNGAANDQELARTFAKLPISKNSLDNLMDTIVQTAVSKEAMYPAIKELYEKFGPFMESKKEKLDSETLHRYKEQYKILGRLMKLYDDETENNKDDKDQRAQKIANLWMEMQKYGLPPPELANNMHSGLMSSENDEKLENECVLM